MDKKIFGNGVLDIEVDCNSGFLLSLRYQKKELLKRTHQGDLVFLSEEQPQSKKRVDHRFFHTKGIEKRHCYSWSTAEFSIKNSYSFTEGGKIHLVIITGNQIIEIEKEYILFPESSLFQINSSLRNLSDKNIEIEGVFTGIDGIRIGQNWDDEYIHPTDYENRYNRIPFRNMKNAVYHSPSSPTGLTLPYLMAYNQKKRLGLWFSHAIDKGALEFHISADSKNRTGSLAARVGLYKVFLPGEKLCLGETSVKVFQGNHYEGMANFLDWFTKEKGVLPASDTPVFVDNLIFGEMGDVDFYKYGRSFEKLIERLYTFKKFGVNAIMLFGCWYATEYHSKYEGTFKVHCCIIPQNGLYEPEPTYGGREGLKKFLDAAHKLGIKIIPWFSTSGLAWEATEVKKHPDWWVYRKDPLPNSMIGKNSSYTQWLKLSVKSRPDEYLDYGYGEIALGDGFSPGYREFTLKNIKQIHKLGFDGVFYDSLMILNPNYKRYPWYGESYRSYIDLARYIRTEMKKIDKNFFFMGECKGWEAAQYIDFCVLRTNPAPPSIPLYAKIKELKPEDIQDFLRMESLSRLPGQKTFSANGFIRDGFVSDQPEEKRLPWFAYAILSDNYLRVWPYHAREDGSKVHRYPWGWIQEPSELNALEKRFWLMVKKLIRLRKKSVALQKGSEIFEGLEIDNRQVVIFSRIYGKNRVLCLLNFTNCEKNVVFQILEPDKFNLQGINHYKLINLYGEGVKMMTVSRENLKSGIRCTVPCYGVRVFELK